MIWVKPIQSAPEFKIPKELFHENGAAPLHFSRWKNVENAHAPMISASFPQFFHNSFVKL